MAETHEMTRVVRRLVWSALAALVVVGATVAAFYVLQRDAQRAYEYTREVSRIARMAAALASGGEKGVRSYARTHSQTSLVPELTAKAQLPPKLDSLESLTRANPTQHARVAAIVAALKRWEDEYADPAITREITPGTMLAGKPLFDQVRRSFDDFLVSSERQLDSESARVKKLQILGLAVLLAELIAFFGILLSALRGRLMSQATELEHQQELLEQQAVELELQLAEVQVTNDALAEREERLTRSEERYRFAARATNDAIYDWNIGPNEFEWREGMTGLFGYGEGEIQPTPEWITSLVHPDDTERVTGTFFAVFEQGGNQWKAEYRLRRKDGKYANVEGRAYIIRGPDGAPTRVIGAISDRTQQQSLESQLRQSQKMEAIGRLAGGIAHDFNNILTVIRMSSEFLLSGIPETDEKYQDAQEIMKAGERAARLTRQLLAFSRHQVLNPTQLSLNDVVNAMEGMVRRVVSENIEITTELEPSLFSIRADAGQMEQVLLNLVINAADAMPSGGNLSIRISNATVDSTFSALHLDVLPGEYACMTVSDTGIGMDQETVARIFEPFFTTKGVGKGTGLGLSTVHGIVTQSGGRIWVYSEPGTGTTFKIFLPRTQATSEALTTTSVLEESEAPTETILLVEDEEQTREAVQRTLVRAGYKVIVARTGVDALELATVHNGAIDLVLTDSMMPEVGGAELARRLRKDRPDIHIVMMSGYTEDALEGDVDVPDRFFIEKPFTRVELMTVLRSALKG